MRWAWLVWLGLFLAVIPFAMLTIGEPIHQWLVYVLWILGPITGVSILWTAATYGQRNRDRLAQRIGDREEDGPFSLYLRSFNRDYYVGLKRGWLGAITDQVSGAKKSRSLDVEHIEFFLSKSVSSSFPLIGLGRRQRRFGKSGAGQFETDDETWQAKVTDLLNRSVVIFMVPAATSGTLWEVEQLSQRKDWRDKTIFLMPNASPVERARTRRRRRMARWASIRNFMFGRAISALKFKRSASKSKTKSSEESVREADTVAKRSVWRLITWPFRTLWALANGSILIVRIILWPINLIFRTFIFFGALAVGLFSMLAHAWLGLTLILGVPVLLMVRFVKARKWNRVAKVARKWNLELPRYQKGGLAFRLDDTSEPIMLTALDATDTSAFKQIVENASTAQVAA